MVDGRASSANAPASMLQRVAAQLATIVADRLDRATLHCLFAKTFLLRRLRLLIDIGMSAVVITLEISRRRLATKIAIDALIIDVKLSRYIFGIFVSSVGHISWE